jgi:serine/threonine-protein kinase
MSLFAELKRRNVIRLAGLYLVGAWLLVQVASTLFPAFNVPGWALRALVIVLALGFIPAVVFAWAFELTPDGIRRDAEVDPARSIAPQTAQRMNRLTIAALVLALAYFAFDRLALAPRREAAEVLKATQALQAAAPPAGRPAQAEAASIAVLPFVNMSADPQQDYFSDGLSEELLNLLAQLPQLRVIARTSSFSFKGDKADVATIARKLNVDHVLEGSVRKSGNTLRITAQLIRSSDSSHLWSQTYDRELTDVFKVQDEIAAAVVAALKLHLLPAQAMNSARRSDNPEAYNQYLLGNEFLKRENPDDWRRAVAAYRRAIALDGKFAAAYAGLANSEGNLADMSGLKADMEQALADADRAVALAPELPDGHVVRGISRLSFKKDWAGAQADFEKALALSPGDSQVQIAYGRLMIAMGRVPEAIAASRKAVELDPLSSNAWDQLGRLHYAMGRYPDARQALDRALEISPDGDRARYHRGVTSLLEGKPLEALPFFRARGSAYGGVGIAMAQFSLGHARESQQALEDAIARYAQGAAYQIAEAYAWRGEKDKAFEWLDRAYDQHDGGLTFIKTDPLVASLVGDPRYVALMRKMGLPE